MGLECPLKGSFVRRLRRRAATLVERYFLQKNIDTIRGRGSEKTLYSHFIVIYRNLINNDKVYMLIEVGVGTVGYREFETFL